MTLPAFLAFFFALVWVRPVCAEVRDDSSKMTVEMKSGEAYRCRLSHSAWHHRELKYYLCGPADRPLILVQSKFSWQAVEKPRGGSWPKLSEIAIVKDGDRTLYAGDGGYETGLRSGTPKRSETLADRYRSLSAAMQALDPAFGQFGGKKTERKKGSEAYEQIWRAWSSSAQAEIDRIVSRFGSSDPMSVELSNGQTIQCHRGRNRDSAKGVKSSPSAMPPGGCELFSCPRVTVDGRDYDVLLFQNASPNAWARTHITLSRKGELGPPVSVTRSYAGAKRPENLLYEEVPLPADMNLFAAPPLQVPDELKSVAGTLPQYFDSQWIQTRRYWRSRCDDRKIDALLAQENDAFEKVRGILARAETIQVVSWVNGVFTSQLVPKTGAPQGACRLSTGALLTAEGAAKLADFEKRFGGAADQAVTPEEARRIFAEISSMEDLPFEYLQDGCQARAHVIADRLAKKGIQTQKVWITGDLKPVANPQVAWNFHVAPVIQVRNEDGTVEKRVIDPSLAREPVSVEKWASLIDSKGQGPLTYSAFPPPDNAVLYQRAVISFSSSSVYVPAMQGENALTPEAMMEDAIRTNADHRRYLDRDRKGVSHEAR